MSACAEWWNMRCESWSADRGEGQHSFFAAHVDRRFDKVFDSQDFCAAANNGGARIMLPHVRFDALQLIATDLIGPRDHQKASPLQAGKRLAE